MEKWLRDEWCAALRSGKYKQGFNMWVDMDGSQPVACGNGVLQFILARKELGRRAYAAPFSERVRWEIIMRASQVRLVDYLDQQAINKIVSYNDHHRYTYRQLAAWIEANVPLGPYTPPKAPRVSKFVKTPEQEAAAAKHQVMWVGSGAAINLPAYMHQLYADQLQWAQTIQSTFAKAWGVPTAKWSDDGATLSFTIAPKPAPKTTVVSFVEHALGKAAHLQSVTDAALEQVAAGSGLVSVTCTGDKVEVSPVTTATSVTPVPKVTEPVKVPEFDVVFNEAQFLADTIGGGLLLPTEAETKIIVPDLVPAEWVTEVMLSA